ncbi:cytochrome c biogenesis protein [Coriobacteriia bacterium Es71-Z0120]|uniref:cytochrome c biogenesis protein CcsA n=1 Tax=Parvivirga hydrogeniphila TaxID=2939460 RepID=UPI002261017E|nr:cytochrome c biogenesis protein CcsA [Parvivirga hydrogeniphila]MCL4079186.1 cytochrome c biogenesis protein [Parvivirga hydrogeniphila]
MAVTVHTALYWAACGFFAAALVAALVRPQRSEAIVRLLACGLALQAASAIARWTVTGHPPVFGTFENTIAASWAVALTTAVLVARMKERAHPLLVRLMLGWVVAILAYGQAFDKTPYPLTISERSLFIDIHVLFAWTAFSMLVLAGTAGFVRLAERNAERSAELDSLIVRGVGLGFAAFSAMMMVGSVYSYVLFADWYRWEIVGTTAFAAWLGYALTAHAYAMFGWRGRRIAWCVLALLPLVLAVFWSWSIMSNTYHHFDIPDIRAW